MGLPGLTTLVGLVSTQNAFEYSWRAYPTYQPSQSNYRQYGAPVYYTVQTVPASYQPAYPTNQPVQSTHQPIPVIYQPIQPSHMTIKSTHQPIVSSYPHPWYNDGNTGRSGRGFPYPMPLKFPGIDKWQKFPFFFI